MNKKLIILAVLVLAIAAELPREKPLTAAPATGASALCNTPTVAHLTSAYTITPTQQLYFHDNQCKACPTRCTCADSAPTVCTGCYNPRHHFIPADTAKNIAASCWDPYATAGNAEAWTDCEVPCVNQKDASVTCSKCNAGFFFDKTKCTACPSSCEVCSIAAGASAATCSVCKAGFYLKDGKDCTACDTTKLTNCAACSKDGATCTACTTGNFLIGGKCESCPTSSGALSCSAKDVPDKCADGYFLDKSATPAKCTACIANCRTCTDATTCTACNKSTGKVAQNDWVGVYYDASGKTCKDCADANAIYCNASGEPLVCKTGYTVQNKACKANIPSCVEHAWGAALWCKTCATGKYTSKLACVDPIANCKTHTNGNETTDVLCSACNDNYTLNAAKTACVKTAPNCDEQDTATTVAVAGVDQHKCKSAKCKADHALTTDGICLSTTDYAAALNAKAGAGMLTCVYTPQGGQEGPCTKSSDGCKTASGAWLYKDTANANAMICKPKTWCPASQTHCTECTEDSAAAGTAECKACGVLAETGYVVKSKACAVCTKADNSNTACPKCPDTYWYTADACKLVKDTHAETETYCATWGDLNLGCKACKPTAYLVTGTANTTPNKCLVCLNAADSAVKDKIGDKCAECTATACSACDTGASLVAGKCAVDSKCKTYTTNACRVCTMGNIKDSTGACVACDATKGCVVAAGGNCDLTAKPAGPAGGAATVTAKSSSAILSFAFSALLLVLAVLF